MRTRVVSIIIPARNEEANIGFVLTEIERHISGLSDEHTFEIIVVTDHCSDNTEAIARQNNILVYSNDNKPGKGNAVRKGIEKCHGEIIITLDGDGSHEPQDLPIFIKAIEEGSYLVVGSRAKGGSDEYEIIRLFGNVFFTLLVCSLFKIRVTDALNGYKAFRREVFFNHRYTSSGFEIEVELLYSAAKNRYRITEIPSHERMRMGGEMKSQTLIDGLRFLYAIIKWGLRVRLNMVFRFLSKGATD